MHCKTPLRDSLFQIANIILLAALLSFFFYYTSAIVRTLPMANRAALKNLRPNPSDHLWRVNILGESLNADELRLYTDYFRHFEKAIPDIAETKNVLAYCYLALDQKDLGFKKSQEAIEANPYYFWNYYNLAMLHLTRQELSEAKRLLEHAVSLNPLTSLMTLQQSAAIYMPLLPITDDNRQEIFKRLNEHLNRGYQQAYSLLTLISISIAQNKQQEVFQHFKPEFHAF